MKKVGILYDNISGNTGDVAIGLSVKKILRKLGVSFDELVPGRFNPNDYDVIVHYQCFQPHHLLYKLLL